MTLTLAVAFLEALTMLMDHPLNPLLKWRGGKTTDLKYLRKSCADLLPRKINRYFEPFVGGGAVWLATSPRHEMYVNDNSQDLMLLYGCISGKNSEFFAFISKMADAWDLLRRIALRHSKALYHGVLSSLDKYRDALAEVSLGVSCFGVIIKTTQAKLTKARAKDARNKTTPTDESRLSYVEGALKAGYYTYIRSVYNKSQASPLRAACFYFLRDYSFSAMFRFNAAGEFNVPYGGISYNGRSPSARADYWMSDELQSHLDQTQFDNTDFEVFLRKHNLKADDFIFIDPPYDSEFSTYDKNEFGPADQERLAHYLIHKTKAQFLAVMKNTDFIWHLYAGHEDAGVRYVTFDKRYQVSIKNRNDPNVEHLVVCRTNCGPSLTLAS